jgi:rhodanese-related sulfurtransferase
VLEAVVVVVVAAGFGFATNALSPTGLKLGRDYFPKTTNTTSSVKRAPEFVAVHPESTNEPGLAEIDRRIKDKGLQPVDRAEVEKLFHDPRYQQGQVIFIDARDDSHYSDGHIPGAYKLDRYHPEKDLAADLNPCDAADQVIVYCSGGECEDAEYAALLLRDAGVPIQKLFVYGGGFDDWSANHLPLEQGARASGVTPTESK